MTARYFPFAIVQPNGILTRGVPPVLVRKNSHCSACKRVHDIEACPLCGSSIEVGYGLAFGGCGEYKACSDDHNLGCRWFWKSHDADSLSAMYQVMSHSHWFGAVQL